MLPQWLDVIFTPGATFAHEQTPDPVAIAPLRNVTDFTLVSGKLMICDPGYIHSGHFFGALHTQIPPGTYPLQEATVSYQTEFFGEPLTMHEVIAIRLLISDEPTVAWSAATSADETAPAPAEGEQYGFAVDSGMGCFLDEAARDELMERVKDGGFSAGDYSKAVDPATGAELLMFPTGGDGGFAIWVGFDLAGAPTSVVFPSPFYICNLTSFVGFRPE